MRQAGSSKLWAKALASEKVLAPADSLDRCRFQPLGIAFAGNRSIEQRPRYFRSGERFLGGRSFGHLSVEQFLHGCGLNGAENLYSRGSRCVDMTQTRLR